MSKRGLEKIVVQIDVLTSVVTTTAKAFDELLLFF